MRIQDAPLPNDSLGLSDCLEKLAERKESLRPGATYRLQFNRNFRLNDARELIPYFQALGISTLYASPLLQAREGSTHGYDITDHNKINSEIGSEEELRELAAALESNRMGLLLDTVPNHMGVGHGTNPWWQDVLQNGRASKFANYFDIDWNPLKPELHNKVLLPILGKQYGEELESGKLVLQYTDGEFAVRYYDRYLPLDPQSYSLVFEASGDLRSNTSHPHVRELRSLSVAFSELPSHEMTEQDRAQKRQREIPFLKQRLRELGEISDEIRALISDTVARVNGTVGDPKSFDTLHRLLEAQAYRLAHWRVSAEEINYRRFFDINDLVGLRMEDPAVFAATQVLIRRLLANGTIQGIRVDHPDGLFNPPQYFTRLQMLYAASQCCGPEPQAAVAENGIELGVQTAYGQFATEQTRSPLYVLVEKILEPGEDLPREWPVDGTVGYDFLNLLNGIFIDTRNRKAFTSFYHRYIGGPVDLDMLVYRSKKLIMNSALSSEVNVLGHMLDEISSTDRRARDFTRKVLREAIRETIACFPVYRTYVDERGNISDRDREYIEQAIARAKRRGGSMPAPVFDFLKDILLLRGNDGGVPIYGYRKQLYFTLKFQQLTGPVMAKGMEDTTCYIYNRFVSVNEVGGSPRQFGVELDEFHHGNRKRLEDWPSSMLATSTHDTKRSEDVRMRLDVLSEIPRVWAAAAMRWRRTNRGKKRGIGDGRAVPDLNEEYLLYQTLAGTWPVRLENDKPCAVLTREERPIYIKRIQEYMTKAVHEAKVNLSWVNQNPDYVEALQRFIDRILSQGTESHPNRFLQLVHPFILRVAFFGAMNSLSQTLLKLTAPGVPDIYQGQELLDFSLVDPDNRRPVDFRFRRVLLDCLRQRENDASLLPEMLRDWPDGRAKMWVSWKTLQWRERNLKLAKRGEYIAIEPEGTYSRHVIAFARKIGQSYAVAIAPRFGFTLTQGEPKPPLGDVWQDTTVRILNGPTRNLLTGENVQAGGDGALQIAEVLRSFPVALLMRDSETQSVEI
jgi:(1->4)-alpha-D-glucan 1-alpha-D-glucosylmutase